ncbi:hypothetical protein GCM10027416_13880 [Okibacterium endophyticum]
MPEVGLGNCAVRVLTFKDVNVEELSARDFELPKDLALDE